MPQDIKPEYVPQTLTQKMGYLIEEAGELQSAIGSALRWGLNSFNPEIPKEERVTNRQWILDEIHDVERGIGYMKAEIAPTPDKNDYVIRVWSSKDVSRELAHWFWDDTQWLFCPKGRLAPTEQFCLNDYNHAPGADGVPTSSLEGLI